MRSYWSFRRTYWSFNRDLRDRTGLLIGTFSKKIKPGRLRETGRSFVKLDKNEIALVF